jgi:hypothetical protein
MCNPLILAPFFSENTVTGAICLDTHETFCFPQLAETDIMLQKYGALPHFSEVLRNVSSNKFPDRCIGRNGPIL